MPTDDDEQLTSGPTIEPAPPRTFSGFLAMAAADCVEGTDAGPTGRIPRSECTRYSPCQGRCDQDGAIADRPGRVTCALILSCDGWAIYVDGDLVTLIDCCPWCGGRLA